MNLLFDLDGTLIDASLRMYYLFVKLVPHSNLSFQQYWDLKRNKVSHEIILRDILLYDEKKVQIFSENWMSEIEMPMWLDYDKLYPGLLDYLERIYYDNDLYIITARQFEAQAMNQIENLGLSKYFKAILVANKKSKLELILETLKLNSNDWLIGDTGKDIQTGKVLGIKTAAVFSGFLSKERLEEYNPDIVVEGVTQLNFDN